MILVDTSVWVDYVRGQSTPLDHALGDAQIVMHRDLHEQAERFGAAYRP